MAFTFAVMPTPVLGALTAGDVMTLINTSTFFGKLILFLLLAGSVLSWAIYIDKTRTLARVSLPKSIQTVEDLVETLMGKKPELRFKFIQDNAKFIDELDV